MSREVSYRSCEIDGKSMGMAICSQAGRASPSGLTGYVRACCLGKQNTYSSSEVLHEDFCLLDLRGVNL